ncbi:MAG: DNA mismatch repair endonuclease MutL [Rikenellaceae bacterium]
MFDKIRLLPEKVANQIAAGEVVVRPSSVVKEMMENTIDAGATEVVVNFREGGFDLIQIVDNGCGMSPNDARMAFDRHATSKIKSVNDIYNLRTFGFRGEALASIGAVARVELRTKQEGAAIGTLTEVHGGDFVKQTPAMCDTGSQFMVRDLFYNLPVRRRFVDKITTSNNQIKAEFKRVALCYPHIRFELYCNDAPLYSLAPATLAGRIVDIVGRSIKQNLLEVHADTSIVKIKGFVGRPSSAKKSNSDQYLFINGRYFKSAYFAKSILRGYEKLMAEGLNPSFFLFLEVDPEHVDVNIHPQKTEVKFADEESIWQIINAATREALAKSGAVPMMEFDDIAPIEIPVATKGVAYSEPKSSSMSDYNPFREDYIDTKDTPPMDDFTGFDAPFEENLTPYKPSKSASSTAAPQSNNKGGRLRDSGYETIEMFESEGIRSNAFEMEESFMSESFGSAMGQQQSEVQTQTESEAEEFEIIESAVQPTQTSFESIESRHEPISFGGVAPIGGGYISAMLGMELVIVDSRRAKERILYDHYMRILGNGAAVSQQLLFPQRLILSMEEYDTMEQSAMDFALLGFDIDYCGEGVIEVKGVPADESSDQIDTLIFELIQLAKEPTDMEELRRERLAATMARNGSKKLGRYISKEEATELLNQLAASTNISFSPNGKGIFWRITTEDIKNKLA